MTQCYQDAPGHFLPPQSYAAKARARGGYPVRFSLSTVKARGNDEGQNGTCDTNDGSNERSGGQAELMVEQEVIVYVENNASVPNPVLFRARALAAEMFAGVGVRVDWRADQRAESQLLRERAIAVRLARNTPEKFRPGAGAFAFPYGEAPITVLYDRLAWSEERPGLAPALLAHVLVHEITHQLQGICRHSSAGIMKSNWSEDDYYDMQTKTLPFASEDVELIHLGLTQRRSRVSGLGQ